ncbi:hypothetical protein V2H45_21460 [Tumidithrix elongata RA019]|uniref:Uncharacterized protein n=1 Tax=Tumidithrix elongata BACA0141 TaxID=2716417 RepID=A0AAW9PWE6_9CYAN|nr:hypothetical protein [Tumidithrix elongata RA019]
MLEAKLKQNEPRDAQLLDSQFPKGSDRECQSTHIKVEFDFEGRIMKF